MQETTIYKFLCIAVSIITISSVHQVEDVSRMCKAVNTAAHRSGFTLLITTNEKLLGTCLEMLEKDNYTVLVCYIKTAETKSKHGRNVIYNNYLIILTLSQLKITNITNITIKINVLN